MRLRRATVLYAMIFAATCIFSEVFSSDLYCFSCFGFIGEDHFSSDPARPSEKCDSRGNLAVRKCTTNVTDVPVCIKFKGKYKVPQMMGNRLEEHFVDSHGVHCGTRLQCSNRLCPNYWPNDVRDVKECEISCCSQSEINDKSCEFPVPSEDEINEFNEQEGDKEGGTYKDDALFLARGAVVRTGSPVWVLAVSFAFFSWTNL